MQRIGVFVCHCGSNIAATVDVKKVAEIGSYGAGCCSCGRLSVYVFRSRTGLIAKAIEEKQLTGW